MQNGQSREQRGLLRGRADQGYGAIVDVPVRRANLVEQAGLLAALPKPYSLKTLQEPHYAEELRIFLRTIPVPMHKHLRWLALCFFIVVSLSSVTSFFAEEGLEHARDKPECDPQAQFTMAWASSLIFLLPNSLLSAVAYYLLLRAEKIKIAIAQGLIRDDRDEPDPNHAHDIPAAEQDDVFNQRSRAMKLVHHAGNVVATPFKWVYGKVSPHSQKMVDGMVMGSQASVGFSANIALALHLGKLYPFAKSPWFFWPFATVGGYFYGRLYHAIIIHATQGSSDEHGNLFKAIFNIFAGKQLRQYLDEQSNWHPKTKKAVLASYYVAWGILIHEMIEGKFIGDTLVKNVFDGFIATLPQFEEGFTTAAESVPAKMVGVMLGTLVVIFEGLMEAYNAQKNPHFWRGMPPIVAMLTFGAAVLQSIPTVVGLKELFDPLRTAHVEYDCDEMMGMDMTSHGDLAYGIGMLIPGLAFVPASMIGFGGTVGEPVVELAIEASHGLSHVAAGTSRGLRAAKDKMSALVCCGVFGRRGQYERLNDQAQQMERGAVLLKAPRRSQQIAPENVNLLNHAAGQLRQ